MAEIADDGTAIGKFSRKHSWVVHGSGRAECGDHLSTSILCLRYREHQKFHPTKFKSILISSLKNRKKSDHFWFLVKFWKVNFSKLSSESFRNHYITKLIDLPSCGFIEDLVPNRPDGAAVARKFRRSFFKSGDFSKIKN